MRESARSDADVVLTDGLLTAGLVDVQINGAFGVDFSSTDDDGWDRVAAALTTTGVTAFQPTYITAPLGALVSGLHTAIEARAGRPAPGARESSACIWKARSSPPFVTACMRRVTSSSRRQRRSIGCLTHPAGKS